MSRPRQPIAKPHIIRTASQPNDVAELVTLLRTVGPWALSFWRPPGGFVHRDHVDLRAVEAGLRRKL